MTDTRNVTTYRIIYGDTDQMGVAYYANYLRWFEMGRTELLRQLGLPYTAVEANGLRFPVTQVSCRYFHSARYDEKITIETRLSALGRASLMFSYRLRRDLDQVLLAEGATRHACVDAAGRVARIPQALAEVLKVAVASTPDSNSI